MAPQAKTDSDVQDSTPAAELTPYDLSRARIVFRTK